jgi:two-component system sensor histidine kinase DesK
MSDSVESPFRPAAGSARRFRLLPSGGSLGWTPLAWLVYLTAFLVDPFRFARAGEGSVGYWVATVAAVATFLVLYFRGYWVSGAKLVRVALALALLGLVFSPTNYGASVFFVYACSFAATLQPQRRALWLTAAITLAGLAIAPFIDAPVFYWFTVGLVGPAVGGVNLHFTQTAESQRKLRFAHEEIEQLAAVAERERIARDLHDVLGHTLSLIVLKSELAGKLADRNLARAADEMRDVENIARRTLQDVREAIRGYHPTLQDEVARARVMLEAARVVPRFDVDETPLPQPLEEALALAVREAVTNVVRHAGASVCDVSLRVSDDAVRLVIRDDGRGIDGAAGFGLRGMGDRIEALGGTLEFTSDRGTVIEALLPRQRATHPVRSDQARAVG